MNQFKFALVIAALALSASPLMAQQKRVSPHETISTVIDGNRVTIVYGRPYTKDPHTGEARKIWGGLVPYGQIWRTGSDEATLLITQKPISFGDTTIPAGAFTLWTLPNEDGTAKLAINKQLGKWGGVIRNRYTMSPWTWRASTSKKTPWISQSINSPW